MVRTIYPIRWKSASNPNDKSWKRRGRHSKGRQGLEKQEVGGGKKMALTMTWCVVLDGKRCFSKKGWGKRITRGRQ